MLRVDPYLPNGGEMSPHDEQLLKRLQEVLVQHAKAINGLLSAAGNAVLATTATDGFLYLPTCAGTPTGTPTAVAGRAPCVVDTTNNKMYVYSSGSWRALN